MSPPSRDEPTQQQHQQQQQAQQQQQQQQQKPHPLGAFTHLPSYDFDFDYRGHTIPSLPTNPSSYPHAAPYTSPLVDDFDSYMFVDSPQESPHARADTPTEDRTIETFSTNPYVGSSVTDSHQGPHHPTSSSSPSPTLHIDWDLVDAARLYTPNGAVLDPSNLYNGYSTLVILVFVPRHSVELCALVYAKLAQLLQQATARLIFVTAWTPEQATTFLSRFERVAPFPGSVVCDPHATLFSAFNLTRSPLRALFASTKMSAPMRQGVRNALSTVTYRAQNRDIASTPVSAKRLKVGAAVFPTPRGYSKRPNVRYVHEETTQTGVGCYMDVLNACGVNEAFVPEIDVAQLYARFNSMRATSMKARSADEREANRIQNMKHRGSRKMGDRRNALKS